MIAPVVAYRRGDLIAVRFSDGNSNVFDSSLGEDASWSSVCFDGRESGWESVDLEEAERIAQECGLVWRVS